MKAVRVKQVPEQDVPVEVLAQSIVAISTGVKKLRSTRLNDRALFLLIQNASDPTGPKFNKRKPTIDEIKSVLDGIESLERTFLKKKL